MDSTTTEHRERSADYEVAVVGAGQAGLAIGYLLGRQGRRIVILDRASSVGAAWRERWESLTLFTPRCYDSLPGLPFPGDPEGYGPRRGDRLPRAVRRDSSSRSRSRARCDGSRPRTAASCSTWTVGHSPRSRSSSPPARSRCRSCPSSQPGSRPTSCTCTARATGARRRARGEVLVVGGGNTGFQIAKELSATRRAPVDRVSRQMPAATVPRPRPLLVADDVPLFRTTVESRLGQRLRHRDTLIGSSPRELRRRYGSSSGRGRSTRPVAPSASRTGPSSKSTR